MTRFAPAMAWLLLLTALFQAQPARADDLMEAANALAEAVAVERDAQAGADQWAGQRAVAMAGIRERRDRLRRLEAAATRREAYLDKQEAALDDLRRRAGGDEEPERSLEPVLDAVLERLEAHVKADLAFLPEERRARLDLLRQTLGDYSLPMSEKLRRFLEALQVEAAYGARVETEDATIGLRDAFVGGRVLRMGRAAALFLARDGRRAAVLLPGGEAWEPLPPSRAGDIRAALEMLDHHRVFELVVLPVGVRP